MYLHAAYSATSASVTITAFRLMSLCDYQPHPLRFVWSFLAAGLVQSYIGVVAAGRINVWRRLVLLAAAADLLSYCIFVHMVAPTLVDVTGVLLSWLLCVVLSFPIRVVAAQQASGCASCFRRRDCHLT